MDFVHVTAHRILSHHYFRIKARKFELLPSIATSSVKVLTLSIFLMNSQYARCQCNSRFEAAFESSEGTNNWVFSVQAFTRLLGRFDNTHTTFFYLKSDYHMKYLKKYVLQIAYFSSLCPCWREATLNLNVSHIWTVAFQLIVSSTDHLSCFISPTAC